MTGAISHNRAHWQLKKGTETIHSVFATIHVECVRPSGVTFLNQKSLPPRPTCFPQFLLLDVF
jgi:hypothetical protein